MQSSTHPLIVYWKRDSKMLNFDLYKNRGITENKSYEELIKLLTDRIYYNESQYNTQSSIFINRLYDEIMSGIIIVTTPMLYALQECGSYSSCSVVDIDLNQSYNKLTELLRPHLLSGK